MGLLEAREARKWVHDLSAAVAEELGQAGCDLVARIAVNLELLDAAMFRYRPDVGVRYFPMAQNVFAIPVG